MRILFFLVVLQIPLIKSREKKQASHGGGGGGDVAMRWNPKCHDIPLSKNVSGIVAKKIK